MLGCHIPPGTPCLGLAVGREYRLVARSVVPPHDLMPRIALDAKSDPLHAILPAVLPAVHGTQTDVCGGFLKSP